MSLKFLFLDVDGVLNDVDWGRRNNLVPDLKSTIDDLVRWIDPSKVLLVNEIVDQTGADIILSSSTRSDPRMSVVLARAGLRPVLAATPLLQWTTNEDGSVYEETTRADEIYDFLFMWAFVDQVEKFVVLDDQEHDWDRLVRCTRIPREQFLVQTDSRVGITRKNVERAIHLLGEPSLRRIG